MSNFFVFDDWFAADTQPASNSLPDPPPNLPPMYLCCCCDHEKASTEFSPDVLLLATPTPLRESTNEQNIGQKRRRNEQICIACQQTQELRKKRNEKISQARRAKADEGKQQDRIPWKEIVSMIEDGFRFSLLFILTLVPFQLKNFCLFPTFFRNSHEMLYN